MKYNNVFKWTNVKNNMKKQGIIFLMLMIISLQIISAAGGSPHAFYGKVFYSDGTLIQQSLKITAVLGDYNDSSVITNGEYGYGSDTLIIESETGGNILFYLTGLSTSIGNYTFKPFEVTELNFNTDILNPNQSTPSSSPPSGGGSSPGGGGGGGSPSGGSVITNQEFLEPGTETSPQTQKPSEEEKEQEAISSGITGGVTGFIKSGAGVITIFASLIAIIGAFIVVKLKLVKKRK